MIDYDRLTLKGDADYYVSRDATEAGRLQGQGLIDGLEEGASTSRRSPSCTERRPTRSCFSAKELFGALVPPSARCWDGRSAAARHCAEDVIAALPRRGRDDSAPMLETTSPHRALRRSGASDPIALSGDKGRGARRRSRPSPRCSGSRRGRGGPSPARRLSVDVGRHTRHGRRSEQDCVGPGERRLDTGSAPPMAANACPREPQRTARGRPLDRRT